MKTKNNLIHGKKGSLAGFAVLLTSILIITLSSAFGPRLADLPNYLHGDQGNIETIGLLPDQTKEVIIDNLPKNTLAQSATKSLKITPDSTKKKEYGKQKNTSSKGEKTTIVMEVDENMNILSVKENGKELEGDKRKEYEKKVQKIKSNAEKEEILKKKEDALKVLQKELEEQQKAMQKVQEAYGEASGEYFKQLHEMNSKNYFPFFDSGNSNWDIFQDQINWNKEEFAEMQKELAEIHPLPNFPDGFLEPSDFESFDEEKFKDLYNDQFDHLEDAFEEIEKVQELQHVELLERMEDLQKIEDLEMKELDDFENRMMKELKKDQIIESSDDFQSFRLSNKELKVNGEKQSKKLKDKYVKLYEEITNDKLIGTMSVIFED